MIPPISRRRKSSPGSRTVGETLGGVVETGGSLLTAEVCAIRLEEFARAGLVVEVWSAVLDEAVVFVSAMRGWTRGSCGPCTVPRVV